MCGRGGGNGHDEGELIEGGGGRLSLEPNQMKVVLEVMRGVLKIEVKGREVGKAAFYLRQLRLDLCKDSVADNSERGEGGRD